MKRKWFAAAAILILLATLSFGAYSYHTVTGRTENIITAGNIRIQLHQTEGNRENIQWGTTTENTVTVENTGGNPAFVRIALGFALEDAKLPEGCVTLDINTKDWHYQDGFYYYTSALKAGETTSPLFTQMAFDGKGLDAAQKEKPLTLQIDAYGVQSEQNGADPLEAAGWPELVRR